MRPTSRSPRFAALLLALAFLGLQPWVACGLACKFGLHPGQTGHHSADHQAPECHTGSWTQTAVVPFESLNLGLPSPAIEAGLETVTQVVETLDPPTLASSWISAFEPPPPRA